jgi:putative oxidoreductase
MRGKEVDLGLLIFRIAIGLFLLYYGCQKMLGLFGGAGFSQQIQAFQKMGFPPLLGTLSIFAEFFGSLGILSGTLTRVAAFGVFCNMAVATWASAKAPDLFHNIFSYGQPADARTLFYPLVLGLGALGIVFTGSGAFAVDARLFGKSGRKK